MIQRRTLLVGVLAAERDDFAGLLKAGAPTVTALGLKMVREACVPMMAPR